MGAVLPSVIGAFCYHRNSAEPSDISWPLTRLTFSLHELREVITPQRSGAISQPKFTYGASWPDSVLANVAVVKLVVVNSQAAARTSGSVTIVSLLANASHESVTVV